MAASIGQQLRDARQERGLELSDAERATKIRVKFLEAMEADRWEDLPGPPYNRGFLSSYARFLGLDEEAVVEQYKETAEPPEHADAVPPTVIQRGSLTRPRSVRPMALWIAGLVAVILLAVVIGVSLGGSGGGGGHHRKPQKQASTNGTGSGRTSVSTTTPSATTGTTTTTGSTVSVELRATDLVWVCLVDDQGRAQVNSETLTTGETRGPFDGSAFEATFGNGSVDLTVNGTPAKVPQLAEPLSLRITPEGTKRLSPGAGPTCT
jgi:cytoskeleton protein RodZ